MYLFRTLDPHPPTATPILGQSPKKTFFCWMVVFTRKFGTLDPHLPIVWEKVPNKTIFWAPSLRETRILQKSIYNLDRSMYQFRQIHATTWSYPCNHFDKSKTILNYLSNIQNEEWQPDLVTRQGNDRICRTKVDHTFFVKRLHVRTRCDLHFSLQSS